MSLLLLLPLQVKVGVLVNSGQEKVWEMLRESGRGGQRKGVLGRMEH